MSPRVSKAGRKGAVRPVNVFISEEVDQNLEAIERVSREVLGRLGCPACHSGFDIRFVRIARELDEVQNFRAVGKGLEVEEVKFGR